MERSSIIDRFASHETDGRGTSGDLRRPSCLEEEVIANAQNRMAAAYRDAAAALLAAELIDEANLDDVARVMANVWVV